MSAYPAILGSIPALVTPFTERGDIDFDALGRLIDWHIQEGTDALTVAGTTGESATINIEEQTEILRFTVGHAKGRIPIIAGSGANATHEAVQLAQVAQTHGADAHLSVVPYYNKPSQEGIYRHFKYIAESTDLPMILYNVPGRTVADMSTETVLRLAEIPNIVGLKDATGDLERGVELLKHCPSDFSIYSGDDGTAAALMLLGAKGTISVTANVAPKLMHELCMAALAGDAAETRRINEKLSALHRAVFLDPNPSPSKWILNQAGLIKNIVRLPLVTMQDAHVSSVEAALREAEIVLH